MWPAPTLRCARGFGLDCQHNRLATATTDYGTPQALPTTYGYYPDGLLDAITYPNGVVAKHTYDNADRLLTLTNSRSGTTISSYGYQYTDNGNRDQQIEVNGGLTETTTYSYDPLNRLASVSYPGARVVTYGYDLVGNRVVEDEAVSGTPASSKLATFDAANRLLAVTDSVNPAQSASFAYDDNGNQLSKTVAGVTTYYRYDLRDKMVQADQADQGPIVLGRFAYDFEGRRTFKTGESGISSSDSVRYYVYDQASLLTEYDLDQAPVSRYDYGSDRLISLTNAYQGRRYYHFDGLRSVTNLTNDAGATAASYHLDTWGNFRFPQELDASQNRFAFTGYQWDTATGLYNAKARYYDPIYGRFTSQDSYLGEINDPPSLHRYFYANDNPTRYVDLTGHAANEEKYFQAALIDTKEGYTRALIKSPETVKVVAHMTRDERINALAKETDRLTRRYGAQTAKAWVAGMVALPVGAGAGALLARPLGTTGAAILSDALAGSAAAGTNAKLNGASGRDTAEEMGWGALTGVALGQVLRPLAAGPRVSLTGGEALVPPSVAGAEAPPAAPPAGAPATLVNEPAPPPSGRGSATTSVAPAEGVAAPEAPTAPEAAATGKHDARRETAVSHDEGGTRRSSGGWLQQEDSGHDDSGGQASGRAARMAA